MEEAGIYGPSFKKLRGSNQIPVNPEPLPKSPEPYSVDFSPSEPSSNSDDEDVLPKALISFGSKLQDVDWARVGKS